MGNAKASQPSVCQTSPALPSHIFQNPFLMPSLKPSPDKPFSFNLTPSSSAFSITHQKCGMHTNPHHTGKKSQDMKCYFKLHVLHVRFTFTSFFFNHIHSVCIFLFCFCFVPIFFPATELVIDFMGLSSQF